MYFNLQETEDVEKYMIFEFFPDTNYLLPVESKYAENVVYTETTQLGTYCLVKIDDTDSNNSSNGMNKTGVDILTSENKIFTDTIVLDYELGETEVAFLVDISGSLDEEALEETKRSIHDFSQALFEHSENSYVTIIGYFMNPQSGASKLIQYTDSEEMTLLDDIESVESAISNISPCTTVLNNDLNTPVYLVNNLRKDGLFSSDCENKYVFILADSTYTMTNSIGYKVTIPNDTKKSLGYIAEDDIQLNYILSKENYIKSKAINNLKEVCNPLGFGVYSKSETGGFSVKSFAKIYSDAIIDLETLPGVCNCSLNFNSIPEMVERNAFINSLPKSYDKTKVPAADADGKINFKDAAVAVGAATLDGNGNLIFPSLYDVCDMYTRTRIGFEQYMANKNISDMLISGAVKITPFSDKILYEDNDGDGIINKWDASPDEAVDFKFNVIDSVENYSVYDLISVGYMETIKKGEDMYKSSNIKDITKEDLLQLTKNEAAMTAMIVGGCTPFSTTVLGDSGTFGSTPHASFALWNYSSNTGREIIWPLFVPLGLHRTQRAGFYRQINGLFNVAEKTVKPGKTYCFSSTRQSDEESHKFWLCDLKTESAVTDQVKEDWFSAIGGASNALTAEITCYEENDTISYNAKINYYIYDYYDWDGNFLELSHRYGLARNYFSKGCVNFEVNWVQGSRYPAPSHDDRHGNLAIVEFEGIDDGATLKIAYDSGLLYYDLINQKPLMERHMQIRQPFFWKDE